MRKGLSTILSHALAYDQRHILHRESQCCLCSQAQRPLLPLTWREDTCPFAVPSVGEPLGELWIPPELDTKTSLRNCFMSIQSPSQSPAILASHLSHFLSLPQFSSSHFPSLTSQVRVEKLLPAAVKWENWAMCRYKGNTGIQSDWFKMYSSRKERSDLVFGNDKVRFPRFCRKDYTHQGRAIPPENFCIDIFLKKELPA